MRSLAPVVWHEGMHLAQHHFQLRDRYFEDSASLALSSLFFRPYGLVGLELDRDALVNGTVSLIHARGVMPDGLPFSFPDDPPPEPIQIRDLFSPTRESQRVYLAIPPHRRGHANCAVRPAAREDGEARYLAEETRVPDETTGEDEKAITIGRKNFRLLLEGQESGEQVVLPLTRIRRDRSGNFVYDPDYIPPCLQIGASRRILDLLHRLTDAMEAKAESLVADRTGGGGADYATEEIASFWLSHTLHAGLAPLRHHLEAKSAHPSEVFADLLRLGGALCTFSMEAHPRDLPRYDHDDLEACFDALDRHIRTHLEVAFPRRAERVPLEPFRPPAEGEGRDDGPATAAERPESRSRSFLRGRIRDRRVFRDALWFLEVKGAGSRAALLSEVPRLVKICAAQHILRLANSAIGGLRLEHVVSPPAAISPRVGAEYFRIFAAGDDDRPHPCWRALQDTAEDVGTAEVGVHVPEAVEDLELEILIVRES